MAIGIEENGNLLIHPDHPMYHQIRCGSTPSTPEAAARSSPGFPIQQSPMFGCKTGKVVCHLSIFLLIGVSISVHFFQLERNEKSAEFKWSVIQLLS
jgi:hypothetical protein